MKPQQRDIYLIEFGPSVGHEYQKFRPAIVLMGNKVIARSNIITCVPLTSNDQNYIKDDIMIKKGTENMLREDSIVKMHHITACDKSRLKKYIGQIGEEDWLKIIDKTKEIFGL